MVTVKWTRSITLELKNRKLKTIAVYCPSKRTDSFGEGTQFINFTFTQCERAHQLFLTKRDFFFHTDENWFLNAIVFYRPQRSWGKVMFLRVCDSVHRWGGGSSPLLAGIHPARDQRQTPPGADTSLTRDQMQAPPRGACWEIRTTSGRYTSYWNAILLHSLFGQYEIKSF